MAQKGAHLLLTSCSTPGGHGRQGKEQGGEQRLSTWLGHQLLQPLSHQSAHPPTHCSSSKGGSMVSQPHPALSILQWSHQKLEQSQSRCTVGALGMSWESKARVEPMYSRHRRVLDVHQVCHCSRYLSTMNSKMSPAFAQSCFGAATCA